MATQTDKRGNPEGSSRSGQGAGEMTVWDYVRVIRTRFWLLLFVTVFVSTVVAIVTVNLPPTFRARSRVLLEKVQPTIVGVRDFMSAPRTRWFQTQIRIISGRTLVEKAAERVGYKEVQELADEKDPIGVLQQRLKVTPIQGSGLVDVSAEGEDPAFLRDFVNALVDEYKSFAANFRRETSRRLLQDVNNQIETVKKEVEAKRDAIVRYKMENKLGLIEWTFAH